MRWNTGDGRIIPPTDFIPVFEENGLIVGLDEFMFREVCRQQREWIDREEQPDRIGNLLPSAE